MSREILLSSCGTGAHVLCIFFIVLYCVVFSRVPLSSPICPVFCQNPNGCKSQKLAPWLGGGPILLAEILAKPVTNKKRQKVFRAAPEPFHENTSLDTRIQFSCDFINLFTKIQLEITADGFMNHFVSFKMLSKSIAKESQ